MCTSGPRITQRPLHMEALVFSTLKRSEQEFKICFSPGFPSYYITVAFQNQIPQDFEDQI